MDCICEEMSSLLSPLMLDAEDGDDIHRLGMLVRELRAAIAAPDEERGRLKLRDHTKGSGTR